MDGLEAISKLTDVDLEAKRGIWRLKRLGSVPQEVSEGVEARLSKIADSTREYLRQAHIARYRGESLSIGWKDAVKDLSEAGLDAREATKLLEGIEGAEQCLRSASAILEDVSYLIDLFSKEEALAEAEKKKKKVASDRQAPDVSAISEVGSGSDGSEGR